METKSLHKNTQYKDDMCSKRERPPPVDPLHDAPGHQGGEGLEEPVVEPLEGPASLLRFGLGFLHHLHLFKILLINGHPDVLGDVTI